MLADLLVAQVFSFYGSQFRAVAGLPLDLLVLCLVSARRRTPVAYPGHLPGQVSASLDSPAGRCTVPG